ncbi:WD40-repeat-containing domain protein [Phycomyces blakesleeanus]|uniref:WD40-repeat-containing domain protein n=1 Tax=Phycomyces blakesleeanus TaxID=4837 RepID=A0ABR3AIH9_PHYBL
MSTIPLTPIVKLDGHKAPVICLKYAKQSFLGEHLLASGSEDNTCRIWDLRSSRVVKGIQNLNSPVSSISFAPQSSCPYIYLSSGTKVYTFDLRNTDMILAEPAREYNFSADEINAIDVNEKNTFLATADDDGYINVVDLSTHKIHKSFSKKHNSIAMAVKFRPKKPWQVWSGGLDSKVFQWDFSRGMITETFDMNPSEPTAAQMFNPPFVYSLAVSKDGQIIAAGLGDSTVQLISCNTKKRLKNGVPTITRLENGHKSMVNSLTFLPSTRTKLVSGSANGSLALWEWSELEGEQSPTLGQTFQLDNGFVKLNWVESFDVGDVRLAAAGVGKAEAGALAIYSLE